MKALEKMKGQKVIIRSYGAGVFYGTLTDTEHAGDKYSVALHNCRRIWFWSGAASLSQLAAEGVKSPQKCKFSVTVDSIIVSSVIEIIPTTLEAQENLEEVPVWKI